MLKTLACINLAIVSLGLVALLFFVVCLATRVEELERRATSADWQFARIAWRANTDAPFPETAIGKTP